MFFTYLHQGDFGDCFCACWICGTFLLFTHTLCQETNEFIEVHHLSRSCSCLRSSTLIELIEETQTGVHWIFFCIGVLFLRSWHLTTSKVLIIVHSKFLWVEIVVISWHFLEVIIVKHRSESIRSEIRIEHLTWIVLLIWLGLLLIRILTILYSSSHLSKEIVGKIAKSRKRVWRTLNPYSLSSPLLWNRLGFFLLFFYRSSLCITLNICIPDILSHSRNSGWCESLLLSYTQCVYHTCGFIFFINLNFARCF